MRHLALLLSGLCCAGALHAQQEANMYRLKDGKIGAMWVSGGT